MKNPFIYIITILLFILFALICPFNNRHVIDCEHFVNATAKVVHPLVKTTPNTLLVDLVNATPTAKVVDYKHLVNPNVQDDYWIVPSPQQGVVVLQKAKCENCTKIIFNASQIEELHQFMMKCIFGECPVAEWPHGFSMHCSPVVKMRRSDLYLCIDNERKVSSGFIYNHTLNYHAIQLLSEIVILRTNL